MDMTSYDFGRKIFLKVGKKATLKKAPKILPDNPNVPIAWRYQLKTVVGTRKRLKKVI
jgi:hypothetical protein